METNIITKSYESSKSDKSVYASKEPQRTTEIKTETVSNTSSQSEGTIDTLHAAELAKNMNNYLNTIQTDLQVEIHKETHTPIFRIVRKEDQKIICEIPPKEMLDMEANMEKMVGSFLNASA